MNLQLAELMENQTVKTRFAPSPTGMMHLGNFRTALYSYLFAQKNKGKFVLRIEDTDQERQVKGAEQAIFRILKWTGLEHDEGPDIGGDTGPYRQSERLEIYQTHIQQLIKDGHAYHCFCSSERLEKMRLEQQARGEAPKYDRHCLNLVAAQVQEKIKAGEPHVIRHKVDTRGQTTFKDLVRGQITTDNSLLDDSVLIKSDGWPTYNFANVIDDHLMAITHVVRGEEYIPSTPKFLQLYHAFGWTPPEHAHLSLILNKNKSKLSKRDGHVSVEDYMHQGYLPETIINFVALLGWNPGDDREIFTLEELTKEFDFDKLNKSGAVFDIEKLDWMNGHYIRGKDLTQLTRLCQPYFDPAHVKTYGFDYLKRILGIEQERLKKLSEIGPRTKYFFASPDYQAELLIWKKSDKDTALQRLDFLIKYLPEIPDKNWTRSTLEETLLEEIKRLNYTNGDVLWPMRTALSGEKNSPSPFEIAEVLGKEESIQRLTTATNKLK